MSIQFGIIVVLVISLLQVENKIAIYAAIAATALYLILRRPTNLQSSGEPTT